MSKSSSTIGPVLIDSLEARFLCSAGDLDLKFGKAGLLTLNGSDGNTEANAVAVQADGKLLVAAGKRPNFPYVTITRYLANGKRDPTFATDGRILLTDSQFISGGLFIQSDGKILTARYVKKKWSLVRYTNKGKPDTSFGDKGIAAGAKDRPTDIVQSGKKIYAVRYVSGFRLERYSLDGKLDSSFGVKGVVTTPFAFDQGSKSYCESVVVQPDGKVLVAGNANEHFAIARYETDGTLDASFGDGGKLVSNLPAMSEAITRIFVQPDGKILATGRNMGDWGYTYAMARYLPNGQVDPTFGRGGSVDTNVGASRPSVMQSDGKIIIVGTTVGAQTQDLIIARYNSNGSLDKSFGKKGKVQADFSEREDPRTVFLSAQDSRINVVVRSAQPQKGYLIEARYLAK